MICEYGTTHTCACGPGYTGATCLELNGMIAWPVVARALTLAVHLCSGVYVLLVSRMVVRAKSLSKGSSSVSALVVVAASTGIAIAEQLIGLLWMGWIGVAHAAPYSKATHDVLVSALQAASLAGFVLANLTFCVSWIDTVVATRNLARTSVEALRRSRLVLSIVMACYLAVVVALHVAMSVLSASAYTLFIGFVCLCMLATA